MEHAWTKIKSWVNTQLAGKANSSHTHTYSQITDLSSWKTTSFGSGAYNNTGTITVSNNLNVATNVQISGECELIIDTPYFEIHSLYGSIYTATVTKRHGIMYILPRSDTPSPGIRGYRLRVKNMSGETIYLVTFKSDLDDGTGTADIPGTYTIKPELHTINNGDTVEIKNSLGVGGSSKLMYDYFAPCYW